MLTDVTVNANAPTRTSSFSEAVGEELCQEPRQPVTEVVTANIVTTARLRAAGVCPTQHLYQQRLRR